MNKKANRSNLWYLLPKQAVKDKNLTTSEKNVLSVLIYLSQAFKDANGKFFRQRTKLLDDIKESEFELSDKQVTRCLVKLQHFGYINYKPGFHNNMTGKGSASEFELTYNADNQPEHQNNVYPNTNTNTNTNTKPNTNTKGTIEQNLNKEKENNNTYNISTFSEERNPLFVILDKCDDEGDNLNGLIYLDEHYTNENIEYVRKWWRDKPDWLEELDRFCSHKA